MPWHIPRRIWCNPSACNQTSCNMWADQQRGLERRCRCGRRRRGAWSAPRKNGRHPRRAAASPMLAVWQCIGVGAHIDVSRRGIGAASHWRVPVRGARSAVPRWRAWPWFWSMVCRRRSLVQPWVRRCPLRHGRHRWLRTETSIPTEQRRLAANVGSSGSPSTASVSCAGRGGSSCRCDRRGATAQVVQLCHQVSKLRRQFCGREVVSWHHLRL
mmetsp:Transcript_22621/g.63044  ORF Transcript_22621/g.63044 Transcript_22621/m.63044 type:complete len:214 (+) Transcript_22621:713-1354(+)